MLFLGNHRDKTGATMIEIIAMLAILGLGVTAIFQTIVSGINFSKDTEDRIRAINIAREGVETMTNIRNTNWLRYSSNKGNCWNTLNYDASCISTTATTISATSYMLKNQNQLWTLSGTSVTVAPTDAATWNTYFNTYWLWVDANGFYVASGGISPAPTVKCIGGVADRSCISYYTREVNVTSVDPLRFSVIVYWNTRAISKVTINSTLTNWKWKF